MKKTSLGSACLSFALLLGCASDDGDTKKSSTSPASVADAGKTGADASTDSSTGEVDSGPALPPCDDDPATPGNDCPGIVGCREAPECALATSSCCVPGFDIPNVRCSEGTTCETGGRASCDGPEDCNGGFCCVSITAGTATCNEMCKTGEIQLCHVDADCGGLKCMQGGSFTWWGICR